MFAAAVVVVVVVDDVVDDVVVDVVAVVVKVNSGVELLLSAVTTLGEEDFFLLILGIN